MWIIVGTIAYLLSVFGCIAAYAVSYLSKDVQVQSFGQLLYTLKFNEGGAENTILQILQGFLVNYFIWFVLFTALYLFFLRNVSKNQKHKRNFLKWRISPKQKLASALCCILTAVMCAAQIREGWIVLGVPAYLEQQNTYSTLFEDYYQSASETNVVFPEKKKNLIYIMLESMEQSYASTALGGGMDQNLIPNLTRLAVENNDFNSSDNANVNGGLVTNNASWTIAGIVAQSAGIPLCIENKEFTHNFEGEMAFLPNVKTLGDLLLDNGYHNYFMCGSESAYAGRANYFQQHGNYEIFDLQSARDEGKIPQDYKVWWGYEDAKLVDYAKEKITMLAEQEEPFNFTMLTVDTHFQKGYKCEDCRDNFDNQMENVIHCSDKRIGEFVKWIQEQPFYEDTVVVIAGDHLNMDGLIPEIVAEGTSRKSYFCILNGPEYAFDQDRTYTTMDIFPTIAASLGAQIEGDRLGLGTNLYSDVPTLVEEMGFTALNDQITCRSNLYENVILGGHNEPNSQ